jgi:excisionase family DNA binding protein
LSGVSYVDELNNRKKLSEFADIITISELCNYLEISRNTAYKFLKVKKIKYAKVGREYKISKASLAEYLGVKE